MGLDITYYSSFKQAIIPPDTDEDDLWDQGFIRLRESDGFDRNEGISGWIEPVWAGSFRAGSYSGYGSWRRKLCKLVHGVEIETVWNDIDAWEGKPFIELINFSDCEGVIGPETSAKLAKDFEDYQDLINSAYVVEVYRKNNDWWLLKYDDWCEAFKCAAKNGFVQFH